MEGRHEYKPPGRLSHAIAHWESALDTTLHSTVVPYGYTATIWSAGALLIHFHGTPSTLEAFGFVAGALFGFGFLALVATRHTWRPRRGRPLRERPDPPKPLLTAGFHIGSVGLALGAASLLDRLPAGPAWGLASFAATTIYLAGASAELAISNRLARRTPAGDSG